MVEKKLSDVELLDSASDELNLISEVNGEWKRLNGKCLNNIFIAEYNVTTPDELVKAYRSGKQIILKVMRNDSPSYGTIVHIDGYKALNDAENFPNPQCVIYFIAGYRDDYTGGINETGYRCSCNYTNNWDIKEGWAAVKHNFSSQINNLDSEITNLKKYVDDDVISIIPVFKAQALASNSKFRITKAGLYLFAGADYNLKFRGANDSTVGSHDNNLLITLFVSHVGTQGYGNYHAFVGKTYKSTLTTSAESGNIYWADTSAEDICPYIENTDSTNNAMVYYLN